MRIATLLPSATEIVCALGAFDELVAVSHDCDYPPQIRTLPRVTATPIDLAWPSNRIDEEVVRLRSQGRPVIGLDAEILRQLRPDLLVTQSLCDVCAVADGEAFRVAEALDPAPRVVALEASDVAGIARDIETVGAAIGREAGARALVEEMHLRLRGAAAPRAEPAMAGGSALTASPSGRLAARPPCRLLCLEWLDPPYLAGHWVPELVAYAGGIDIGAAPGERSRRVTWEDLAQLDADLIVVMLCGFGGDRARTELDAMTDPAALKVLRSAPVWLLDGGSYTSRPGPRVAEGAERLASAIVGESAPGLERWQ